MKRKMRTEIEVINLKFMNWISYFLLQIIVGCMEYPVERIKKKYQIVKNSKKNKSSRASE